MLKLHYGCMEMLSTDTYMLMWCTCNIVCHVHFILCTHYIDAQLMHCLLYMKLQVWNCGISCIRLLQVVVHELLDISWFFTSLWCFSLSSLFRLVFMVVYGFWATGFHANLLGVLTVCFSTIFWNWRPQGPHFYLTYVGHKLSDKFCKTMTNTVL
jgi:hypothetical protein